MIVSYPNLIIQGLASSYYHYGVSKFSYLPQEIQENTSNHLRRSTFGPSFFLFLLNFLDLLLFFLLLAQHSKVFLQCVCVCFGRDIQGRESIDLVFLILPMYALTKVLFHYSIVLLSPKPLAQHVVFSCSFKVVAEIQGLLGEVSLHSNQLVQAQLGSKSIVRVLVKVFPKSPSSNSNNFSLAFACN